MRPAIAIGSAPNQRSVNRYRECAPVWPGQAPDAAWGQRPMAWASIRCGHGKRTASKLGMRPVTLRRISQHPPVTSKLGLSSRLALPAHFHRQPGFLMCGLLKLNLTERGALSRHFCVFKVITTAHAHNSGVIFHFFQELSNKKKLRLYDQR